MDHIDVVHTDHTDFFLDDPFEEKQGKGRQGQSKKDEVVLYVPSKHTKYVKTMAVGRRSSGSVGNAITESQPKEGEKLQSAIDKRDQIRNENSGEKGVGGRGIGGRGICGSGIGGRERRGGDRQCLKEKKDFGHHVRGRGGRRRWGREYIGGGDSGTSRGGIHGLDQNPTILKCGGGVQDEHVQGT
ncbi:unnamed protein product [Allacma fusca]|uniref:Uncharacterized protein n=1 Tax=Allacma fusca TaxID=39272 RepID=A0A8J2K1E0_9HEXA|nr:unnamed protein product [Allacma fusca]